MKFATQAEGILTPQEQGFPLAYWIIKSLIWIRRRLPRTVLITG